VGEGVLEGVLPLGEQARLVEELCPLELRQAAVQRFLREVGNGLQQDQGHLMADDCRSLQQVFGISGQAVNTCRQDGLHRGWHLNRWERLSQMVGPRGAHQHLSLHQGAHALLQKERVALGAGNQEWRERLHAGIVPQQSRKQFLGTDQR